MPLEAPVIHTVFPLKLRDEKQSRSAEAVRHKSQSHRATQMISRISRSAAAAANPAA